MNAPVTPTGNPEAATIPEESHQKTEYMGEGHVYGHLVADPELRYTPTGRAVTKARLAFNPRIKDAASGKWSDGPTEYYDIMVWGQQGENVAECLQKGDRVVCAGTWSKRTWRDREGKERETIELTARDIGPSLLFRTADLDRTPPARNGGRQGGSE
jgi:single-strand DNA-binding protein